MNAPLMGNDSIMPDERKGRPIIEREKFLEGRVEWGGESTGDESIRG
jgi:hypothetical protein